MSRFLSPLLILCSVTTASASDCEREDVLSKPLFKAVCANDQVKFVDLMKSGVSVNETYESGFTSLALAAAESNLEFTKFLLSQKDLKPNTLAGETEPKTLALHEIRHTWAGLEILKALLADPRVDPNQRGPNRKVLLSLFAYVEDHGVDQEQLKIRKAMLNELLKHPSLEVNAKEVPYLAKAAIPVFFFYLGTPGNFELFKMLWSDPRINKNNVEEEFGRNILAIQGMLPGEPWYFWACNQSPEDLHLDFLLNDSEINVNAIDRQGFSVLSLFLDCGRKENPDALRLLLGRGDLAVNQPEPNGNTPLLNRVIRYSGRSEYLKLFLTDPRLNVNARDQFGRSALFYALKGSSTDLSLDLLALKSTDVNAKDHEGMPVVLWAAQNDGPRNFAVYDEKVVSALLSKGDLYVSYNSAGNDSFLKTLAIRAPGAPYNKARLKMAAQLILARPDIDINAVDTMGLPPLYYAIEGTINNDDDDPLITALSLRKDLKANFRFPVMSSSISSVRHFGFTAKYNKTFFSRADVDVNEVDENGTANIHDWAARNVSFPVFAKLARLNINLPRNSDGQTPLIIAVEQRKISMIRALLADERIEVNHRDKMGKTALDYANWSSEVREMIRSKGGI